MGEVDVFITGDKDFYCVDIEKPQIISPKDFVEMYKKG
jgi:predicted nucleic acid-binding protein